MLATTPVDQTTNGVHTSVYTDVNGDVEFTLVITYNDASATGVATNVVLSHEHSVTNEVLSLMTQVIFWHLVSRRQLC